MDTQCSRQYYSQSAVQWLGATLPVYTDGGGGEGPISDPRDHNLGSEISTVTSIRELEAPARFLHQRTRFPILRKEGSVAADSGAAQLSHSPLQITVVAES